MADIVSPKTRSRMMAGIKSGNTKPEIVIRSGLHKKGFRFRLHDRKLPGKPDLVFPRHGAVIFVNGCFWHGHDCHLFKWPKTREDFWKNKISSNKARDITNIATIKNAGWRVAVVWECALKGKARLELDSVIDLCSFWLRNGANELEVRGNESGASI
ncbi:very short patch repair endonuclease [Roseibium sp. HPY-6]|uniref:very short patch repair endonuclease n=1 Tax=Roseibium sp. HPY-6 TaxID=3229852 RepID=UPI00338E42EA